jgi:hypothetical protein
MAGNKGARRRRSGGRVQGGTLAAGLAGALAVVVAGSGCHAAGSGTAVAGQVVSSPGCGGPVVEGQPCPNKPLADAGIDVLDAGDLLVARTRTGADGRFRVGVPAAAASYRVKVVLGDPPPAYPQCPNAKAAVEPGRVAVVSIVCASGLR